VILLIVWLYIKICKYHLPSGTIMEPQGKIVIMVLIILTMGQANKEDLIKEMMAKTEAELTATKDDLVTEDEFAATKDQAEALATKDDHAITCGDSTNLTGLVHPMIEELVELNIKRYKDFDNGDLDTYMQAVHEDVHVEVYVKEKLRLQADGIEDYRSKFENILQSFVVREVEGIHSILLNHNVTLNYDGTVTIALNYLMHERPINDISAEKVWKSSGFYINHWVPLTHGNFELKNWKLKNYYIHVMKTSEEFGGSTDACNDLC